MSGLVSFSPGLVSICLHRITCLILLNYHVVKTKQMLTTNIFFIKRLSTNLIFRYNFRYGEDGMHEKLTWETVEDKVNEFKEKYIYPTIINTEVEKESMLWWLQNKLSKHSYDDADNYESDDENLEDDDDDDNKRNESPDKIIEVEKTTESSNMNENINKPTASF